MIAMNEALFEKLSRESDLPVLVEFSAPWCVYCRRIEPAMKKLAEQYREKLVIAQVNIDLEPELSRRERIEVVPTLVLYRNGEALDSIVAPDSKAAIEAFLKDNLTL